MLDLNNNSSITSWVRAAGFVSWAWAEDAQGEEYIRMLDEEEMLVYSPKLSKQDFLDMRKAGKRVYCWNVFTHRWVQIVSIEQDRLGNWQTCYQEIGSWEKGIKMGMFPLWLCSDSTEYTWETVVKLHYFAANL